ncbi:MAG: S-layer homology domain-containing protein, partial [Clostridia bacterium]|nr:S-layer homology domain-containing protein [Clostridia bacterium]
ALAVLLSLAVSAMDNGIMYEIVDDAVTITGYNGISTTIVIPEEIEGKPVTRIARYAFDRMDIREVTIPDTVEEIGEKAFFRCYELTQIKLPTSLKTIGHNAFSYSGLKVVDLGRPNGLESIGSYAFAYCDQLKEAFMPRKNVECGNGVFMECPVLKKIWNEWTYVCDNQFQHRYNGTYSLFDTDMKYYEVEHGLLRRDDSYNQTWGQFTNVEELHINDPVGEIVSGCALNGFRSLKTITLGVRQEHDDLPEDARYEMDRELGIIYNLSALVATGDYEIQYVVPEWEGAEILVLPENTSKIEEGAFNQCKRKAVVFSEKSAKLVDFSWSNTGSTVFFFPKSVSIDGVKTASLEDYDPQTYPYNVLEDVPDLNRFDPIEKIEDNSAYIRTAQALDLPFKDVSPTAWYFEAANYAYHNEITSGTGEGTFSPDMPITRAMFVQMLARIEKVDLDNYRLASEFRDVDIGAWYSEAVAWAYDSGIVSGTGDGLFAPDDNVTREQIAVIMYSLCGDDNTADISGYSDADDVSAWAVEAFGWAVGSGYISGVGDNMLSPGTDSTRAQSLQILYRYIDKEKIDYLDGEINISKAFSDDMIIQRGEKITVAGIMADYEQSGQYNVGKSVKVDLGGKAAGYGVIDEKGRFEAVLDRILPASDEKLTLTVSTKNCKKTLNGIMIGDVYMIVGQSNVFYSINHYITVTEFYETTVFAKYLREMRYLDNVRLFRSTSEDYKYYHIPNGIDIYDDVIHDRGWQKPDDPAKDYGDSGSTASTYYDYRYTGAEPTAAEVYSAFGYCFACEMYERTGVPTGIIQVDAAGYSIGAFMPAEICEKWGTDVKQGLQYTDIITGMKSRFVYNQCIHPLEDLSIAGLIWYQGESDGWNTTHDYDTEEKTFAYRWSELMKYMRAHMGNDDFPVFLTEFPMCIKTHPQMYIDVGEVRADESLAVNMTDDAYLINTADIWTDKTYWEQIHAPAKAGIAKRAANMIAERVYGDNGDMSKVSGPIIKNVEFGDGEITLTFDNVGGGLEFYGGNYGGGFRLLGELVLKFDPIFGRVVDRSRTEFDIKDPAKVRIVGIDKVVIECDHEGWDGIAFNIASGDCFPYNCNLCNSAGIPAGAFASYK